MPLSLALTPLDKTLLTENRRGNEPLSPHVAFGHGICIIALESMIETVGYNSHTCPFSRLAFGKCSMNCSVQLPRSVASSGELKKGKPKILVSGEERTCVLLFSPG